MRAKKSEVIIPEQLVANLATNNARQVYSRVAGLNIWENDGAGLQLSIGGRGLDPNRTSNFKCAKMDTTSALMPSAIPKAIILLPLKELGTSR